MNEQLCVCDNIGHWNEANCHRISRRYKCQSGQIIWKDCNQCICQEDGQLSCTVSTCLDDATTAKSVSLILREKLSTVSPWCTPFKSYYINCSICVCPASGWTSEATCALDSSCQKLPSDFITDKRLCIPNVMYLFPCFHCLCSEDRYFVPDKCVETCALQIESPRRCLSRTFYRKNCNVCWCPDDSIPDEKHCTNVVCNKESKFKFLDNLRKGSTKCVPHTFTKPKCYYCDCNANGNINENACLELDCLKSNKFKYDVTKTTCSPGEMVPICIECFCLRNGQTSNKYCSRMCSYISKLNVLQKVLKDNAKNNSLIDRDAIKNTIVNDICETNTVYLDQGRYCICPKSGNTHFKLCTSMTEDKVYRTRSAMIKSYNIINEQYNQTCDPNTFVDIDCNTCYCSKNGTIDLKWCTYDDCDAKRTVQNNIKKSLPPITVSEVSDTCTPGSISKIDCNFCICPDTGSFNDRVCTKNACKDLDESANNDFLICDPLQYYIVDCNTCICPQDGFKNVARCTKNVCEKNFLRSENCVSGQLFSDDCNVCVCPPNGNKADRVCTNYTCSDAGTPWKEIFTLSKSLLSIHDFDYSTRKLDMCFPGEEFVVDCKVCVCPDMGLRVYASCTQLLCNDTSNIDKKYNQEPLSGSTNIEESHPRTRREDQGCTSFNLTDSSERKECTPGSMYIIRCRQCICPYMGNINHFCRPLPEGTYCEQAFPNYNYLPMGRRRQDNSTSFNTADTTEIIPTNHNHTEYKCAKPGRIIDKCFICECDDHNVIIEEHCFKSNAKSCLAAEKPTFLKDNKLIVM
ncbi:uncharacterized protein LOC131849689 [Achroia grisella]|uniref:uncharacterized protein LOC131849689 n=1 Tax=Achroia grisella TaxID=688607 RepID=UPI0027D20B04|nr:uncharacterized protein LOC131849689 [Achroia grisella]